MINANNKEEDQIVITNPSAPHKLAAAVAAIVGVAMTPPAFSQGSLEEVIVTAQKREQSLQDVPVAVSAFNAEML